MGLSNIGIISAVVLVLLFLIVIICFFFDNSKSVIELRAVDVFTLPKVWRGEDASLPFTRMKDVREKEAKSLSNLQNSLHELSHELEHELGNQFLSRQFAVSLLPFSRFQTSHIFYKLDYIFFW